jgi:hypothetical protein
MFAKLSVALLITAAPVLAQDAPAPNSPDDSAQGQAAPVAYKTKRVCRSIEVVGSSIPRTTCTTKKIPIKRKVEEADAQPEAAPEADAHQ